MAIYNFNIDGLSQNIPVDISASQQTIFAITNSLDTTGYFSLETFPNADGLYTITSPKLASGSYSTSSGILDLDITDYNFTAVVDKGEHSITFTPELYMSSSDYMIRGVNGSSKNNAFISIWKTDNLSTTSDSQSILLPFYNGDFFDLTINWGDGTHTNISSSTPGDVIHTYPQTGSYKVIITGNSFPGFRFLGADNDPEKITEISNWGFYKFPAATYSFAFCRKMKITAGDGPIIAPTSRMHGALRDCDSITRLGKWDVSRVSGGKGSTDGLSLLLPYVSNPDGSGNDFGGDFARPGSGFVQDISDWDMLGVESVRWMLSGQQRFNVNLNNWNTSTIANVEILFYNCARFNQPLDKWDASKFERLYFTFANCDEFDQDIGNWDVSSLGTAHSSLEMYAAFGQAYKFNNGGSDSIKNWNVSNVNDFRYCFSNTVFNQPIGSWDVSNGQLFEAMFGQTYDSLPVIGNIQRFNQNIGGWDMSNATSLKWMFVNNLHFNNGGSDSIRNWNTSNVTNMDRIFESASAFNQPLDGWDTSNITNFSGSFKGATSFDQNLSSWNVESAQNMAQMFEGVTLSTSNYDAILVSWASQSLSSSVVFDGGNSKYTGTPGSEPSASRAKMINIYNWTITDGGPV